MSKTFVYCIKDAKGLPVYVGQTVRGNQRFVNHVADAKHVKNKKQPVVRFIRDCLASNESFTFEIIEHVSQNQLNEREAHWIAEFTKQGHKLLNQTSGGQDGYEMLCEPWNKGKPGSQIAWNKGLPSPAKGIARDEAVKAKISAAHKGKKQTYFYKAVIGTSKQTGEQLGFPSIGHAAKFIGTQTTNVCKVLKGKKPSYKGWMFQYANGVG